MNFLGAAGGGFSFGVNTNGSSAPSGGTNYKSLGFGVVEDDESDAGSDDLYGSNSEVSDDDSDETDDQIQYVKPAEPAKTASPAVQPDSDDDDVIFVSVSTRLPDDAALVKKAKELGLPENFYNYLECPEPESDGETFPWERENGTEPEPAAEKPEAPAEPDVKPASTGFSFNFNSSSPNKSTFAAINQTGFSGGFGSGGFGGFKNAGQALFSNDDNAGNASNGGDDECNVAFKPVLEELPPEIEVTTGLENDIEIFSHRAKLFRFARETTPPEWKERGLGDIKITQNKETKVNILDLVHIVGPQNYRGKLRPWN